MKIPKAFVRRRAHSPHIWHKHHSDRHLRLGTSASTRLTVWFVIITGFGRVLAGEAAQSDSFSAKVPMQKPKDRPLNAAMRWLYDVWDPLEDRAYELYSNFKYSRLEGFSYEKNTVQYAPDGVNFQMMPILQVPPIAPGPFVPDAFADKGDGRGITWGLCQINSDGDRLAQYSMLARFDCDLSLDVGRPAFKHNNLRFDEATYFQERVRLPDYTLKQIQREQNKLKLDTLRKAE